MMYGCCFEFFLSIICSGYKNVNLIFVYSDVLPLERVVDSYGILFKSETCGFLKIQLGFNAHIQSKLLQHMPVMGTHTSY